MRNLTIPVMMLALSLPAAVPAAPYANYSADPNRLLWFMAISDTHIGANGDRAVENFTWALEDAYDIVRPRLTVVCGDLTDANGFLGIPWDQQEDEWQAFRAIIDGAGRTLDDLLDIPGNHDQYGDKGMTYYLRYSLWGKAAGRHQHSVRVEEPFGTYHFLGVATPGNDGALPPADRAGLDAGELAYIQGSLDANADASMHLFFGHHPTGNLDYGRDEFLGAMSVYEASTYIFGHTHSYSSEYRNGTLHVNLDTLGKGDDRNVGIGVIDNDLLSLRVFSAGIWPYVVISAPADAGLGGGNPHAYSVPPNWTDAPVRAVVFATRAPDGVEFQVNGGTWAPMAEVSPNVWQGAMDTTGLEPGRHTLKVRAKPWNDAADTISFRVGATACANGLDDDFDGLTDWPEDPGCESPGTNDEEWILQQPDPGPETVEPMPEPVPEAFAEEIAPDAFSEEAGPDAFAEEAGPDAFVEDVPPPEDPGSPNEDVPVNADPGQPPSDPGDRPDIAGTDSTVPPSDATGGDIANFDGGRGSGGCTAGGDGAGTPAWLLLAALVLFAFRRGAPRSAR